MNRVEQYLSGRLAERVQEGNLRTLRSARAPIDFFSNDYLGLVTTGALAGAIAAAGGTHSTGSTGSRLLSGNTAQTEALEARIAAFHGAEAALLFNSGYDANIGLLSAIASRHTTILSDELIHASLIDGIRLALCTRKYKFAHNNLADLEEKLSQHTAAGPVIVVVESIYSMDGDCAPLAAIAALCHRYHAQLVVDEAHATGIFGHHGAGLTDALGLNHSVFARVHTFGKAMGCHGAVVVGSALLRQYLINFSRSFIYTTALPGHSVQAIACAYNHLAAPSFSNSHLHALIHHFRQLISVSGIPGFINSVSPIQALIVGNNTRCAALAARLQAAGLQVNAILHPTVPAGSERLRVCLHSFNTLEDINTLFRLLAA
jgi:8-amino-7-oxononanoate synthase